MRTAERRLCDSCRVAGFFALQLFCIAVSCVAVFCIVVFFALQFFGIAVFVALSWFLGLPGGKGGVA